MLVLIAGLQVDYGLRDLTAGIPRELSLADGTIKTEIAEGKFWAYFLDCRK